MKLVSSTDESKLVSSWLIAKARKFDLNQSSQILEKRDELERCWAIDSLSIVVDEFATAAVSDVILLALERGRSRD